MDARRMTPAGFFGLLGQAFNPVFLALLLFFLSPMWGMISDLTTIAHPYYLVLIAIAIYAGINFFGTNHIYFPIKGSLSNVDVVFILLVLILVTFSLFLGLSGLNTVLPVMIGRICAPYFFGRLLVNGQIKQFIGYVLPLSLLLNIALVLLELFYAPYSENARSFLFSKYVAYQTVGAFAGYLLVATSVIELSNIFYSRLLRVINGCAIMSSVFVMVHMSARGMLTASLLVIFYVCLLGNISRRYLTLLVLITCALFISFITLPQSKFEHFENLAKFVFPFIQTTTTVSNKSLEIRSSYIDDTIRAVKENPIWGVGPGNFGANEGQLNKKFASPHSTFLQAITELGLVGFTVFLIFNISLGVMCHKSISSRRNDLDGFPANKVVAAMWAFALVQDQFSGNYFNSIQYFFLSALLVTTSKAVQGCRP
ncbi:MAG: O-antigen ligase family protein [Gammaproteobacteria bacterium]|nr:O-antigen ligase family protein [Gammaproteobacteria bacterium]